MRRGHFFRPILIFLTFLLSTEHVLAQNKEYTISLGFLHVSYHRNGDHFSIRTNNSHNGILALYPSGTLARSLLREQNVQQISLYTSNTGQAITVSGESRLGNYICRVELMKQAPGLIHSTVSVLFTKFPASAQNSSQPELVYQCPQPIYHRLKSSVIYYFNGVPGSETYHTVTVPGGDIPDRNQFIYFGDPTVLNSTVLYYENFTALNPYFTFTHNIFLNTVVQPPGSLGASRTGQMAFGFSAPLPSVSSLATLPKKYVRVADTFIYVHPGAPNIYQTYEYCNRFIQGIFAIYPFLSKPEPKQIDWPTVVEKGLHDLLACQKRTNKPIILPFANQNSILAYSICFNSVLGSRLASQVDPTSFVNEQVLPYSDAWYYLFGLIMDGEYVLHFRTPFTPKARQALFERADALIHLAHKLGYSFPLRIKGDYTRPDNIWYEYDCTGAYIYLMEIYYKLSRQDKYLQEAIRAAKIIQKHGFDYPYEFTTTALGPIALLNLCKLTHNLYYLQLSYIPLANILRHSIYFNPTYGDYHGRIIFGLTEAMPGIYSNGWEEQTLIHYLYQYLKDGENLLPSYIKYLVSELLKWKGVSLADSLAPLLPNKNIIYNGIPREWVIPVVKSWYIPLEGFGYLEGLGEQNDRPGRVSQPPYCFGALPEAALLLYHPLYHIGQLYANVPIQIKCIKDREFLLSSLGDNGHVQLKLLDYINRAGTKAQIFTRPRTSQRPWHQIKIQSNNRREVQFKITPDQEYLITFH